MARLVWFVLTQSHVKAHLTRLDRLSYLQPMKKAPRPQINIRTDEEFVTAVGVLQRHDPAPTPPSMSEAIRKAVFEKAERLQAKAARRA